MRYARYTRAAGRSTPDAQLCDCGHPASSHEMVDHDARSPESADWRRREKLARWHWVCAHDTHPDGRGESPWDHVCGCVVGIYDHEGGPTVDDTTPPAVFSLLRQAFLGPEVRS